MLLGGHSMVDNFKDILSERQLTALASIIQVGDAAYRELMEIKAFGHCYLKSIRGYMWTKLVQMQCEIESYEAGFPFEFSQRKFKYGQIVPELRTKGLILHIARSSHPDVLPYSSEYKIKLANNNEPIQRQLVIDDQTNPPSFINEPYYGLLVFGGQNQRFSVIQFPEPGYIGIAKKIDIPQSCLTGAVKETETFERKKAVLKDEFLVAQRSKEIVS